MYRNLSGSNPNRKRWSIHSEQSATTSRISHEDNATRISFPRTVENRKTGRVPCVAPMISPFCHHWDTHCGSQSSCCTRRNDDESASSSPVLHLCGNFVYTHSLSFETLGNAVRLTFRLGRKHGVAAGTTNFEWSTTKEAYHMPPRSQSRKAKRENEMRQAKFHPIGAYSRRWVARCGERNAPTMTAIMTPPTTTTRTVCVHHVGNPPRTH